MKRLLFFAYNELKGVNMRLSDLQNKYIINMRDGKNVGNIIDVKIDEGSGTIISLVIEPNKSFFSFAKGKIDTEISWNAIEKIGEDVILVNIAL